MSDEPDSEFAQEAQKPRNSGARELLDFLAENRKWWLAPLVIALLVLGALVALGGTAAGPFLYSLF